MDCALPKKSLAHCPSQQNSRDDREGWLNHEQDGTTLPQPPHVTGANDDARLLQGKEAVSPHKNGDHSVGCEQSRDVGEVVLDSYAAEELEHKEGIRLRVLLCEVAILGRGEEWDDVMMNKCMCIPALDM
jgi:hypothetical protein